jgi:DNA-binding CsgD family transcriptional regulator
MPRPAVDLGSLRRALDGLAVGAPTLRAFRAGVLDAIAPLVPHDAVLFHALSPRVPLETGVFRGLDLVALGSSRSDWDDFAVELGALRELANERLVATDQDAFPLGTRARGRFEKRFVRRFGMPSLCIVHLIVRGAVHAVIVLLSRRRRGFDPAGVTALRELAPAIAVADALHVALDGTSRASAPVRLVCRDERLTPRQREIVEHVAMGQTNEAIAKALELSPNTARNHLAKIFARVGAANRADLVRLAVLTPATR